MNPFPRIDYVKSDYRLNYNGSVGIETYRRLHVKEQAGYIDLIKGLNLKGRTVCDIGCGGGTFLDCIKNMAQKTIGIEPFVGYHGPLKNSGHTVFSGIEAMKASDRNCRVDLVTSFHVIEHVEDPIAFLNQIKGVIKPGGRAVLVTPNADDILMKLDFGPYQKFNFRTAHRWYFNHRSLVFAAQKAGFIKIRIRYRHNYDLSNFALWLRDGKPTGNAKVGLFNSRINRAWQDYLESQGLADTIALYLER